MSDKRCSDCGQSKPFSEFHRHHSNTSDLTKISAYQGTCKLCRNAKIKRKEMKKKIAAFPAFYWECDGCDAINRHTKKVCECGSKQKA